MHLSISCLSLLLDYTPHGASLVAQLVKNMGLIPGLGRSPGEGKGHLLQYSGLENSMDCTVRGVAELDTTERLSLSLFYPAHFLSLISSTLLPQVPLLQGSFFKILTFSRNRCPFICSLYCAYVLSCFSHVQLFGTLWTVAGHMDCSPPGSSVHGILQARTLE